MSGLIYGAIVVMWVAFLVPMWLKRHDGAGEAKSVDRFSASMKVLARRTTAPDLELPDPLEDSTRALGLAAARRWISRHLPTPLASRGPSPHRSVSAAARRRRVLSAACVAAVLAAALAALGLVSWTVAALVALLPVGYVASIAYVAHRSTSAPHLERRPHASEMPRRRAQAVPLYDDASHTVKINPAPVRRVTPRPDDVDAEPAVATAAAAAAGPADAGMSAGPVPDGFDGPRVGWDPVPVPAPMYVNAPRAPRAVRSIDLDTEGAWTSGRLVADAKAAAAAAVTRSRQRDPQAAPAQRAVGD